MTKKKKWLLGIVCGLATLSIIGLMTILVLGRDNAPPNDDDLRLVRLNIPDKENAYYYFRQAILAINPDFEKQLKKYRQALQDFTRQEGMDAMSLAKTRPSSSSGPRVKEINQLWNTPDWTPAQASAAISRNQDVLKYFHQGLACRYFQVPEIREFNDLEAMEFASMLRTLARLDSVYSLYLFKTGKEKEALDESLKIIDYGHRIEDCGGPLIYYLVGDAVKAAGVTRFLQILEKTSLPADALRPYISKLGPYHVNQRGWANTFRKEYQLAVKTIDDMAQGKMPGVPGFMPSGRSGVGRASYFFQPNDTKTLFANCYRIMIENGSRPFSLRNDFPDSVPGRSPSFLAFISPNSVGKLLMGILLPAFDKVLLFKCQENVSISALQALVAIKCYKLRTGKLPASLDQLVPEYAERVPIDNFDGKPLRYSVVRKLIYSVGEDLKDTGGSLKKEYDLKQPTYRIEF